MTFRPYPGFTITTLIMTAILIALGVWQIQRLHWKENLIATTSARMSHAAIPGDGLNQSPDTEYDRVWVQGQFDNNKEAYVFGTDADGDPVYHVLVPFQTDAGPVFLVDRGIVPKEKLNPASRPAGQVTGQTRVTGIWRTPDAPGFFTPKPDQGSRIWYAKDVKAIAAADGVTLAAPVVIEADATPNPGGWPKGGQTVVDFPNNHLSYIITWFGLAAGLLGVYFAYHISKGRFSL